MVLLHAELSSIANTESVRTYSHISLVEKKRMAHVLMLNQHNSLT
jgi:hypothetical protein